MQLHNTVLQDYIISVSCSCIVSCDDK